MQAPFCGVKRRKNRSSLKNASQHKKGSMKIHASFWFFAFLFVVELSHSSKERVYIVPTGHGGNVAA